VGVTSSKKEIYDAIRINRTDTSRYVDGETWPLSVVTGSKTRQPQKKIQTEAITPQIVAGRATKDHHERENRGSAGAGCDEKPEIVGTSGTSYRRSYIRT